ncbi:MAG: ribosome silencing factor [Actinobacteria bacterium]|nr:ribosome silencing factor [Actinomycetota bacterium]
MNSREQALIAARAADEKKASDIVIQDVEKLLVITDYFVLATGQNVRQVLSIAEAVEETLKKEADIKPLSIEGLDEAAWVLLDYGDFIVHIFQPDVREFYRLETLWGDAPIVDVIEAGITDPVYSERIEKIVNPS